MKQILFRKGQVKVTDVPPPRLAVGTVLVEVAYSCVSAGTELSAINSGSKPLWKRALEEPDNTKKLIKMALREGVGKAKKKVEQKAGVLSIEKPGGYSLSGKVIEVGKNVDDLRVGDLVACSGAQCSYHAQIVCVPKNLVAPIPRGLDLSAASTVTLGAIALQGIRRLKPTLGECFVVIGLGILGQLTVQLLKVNGCRVIGTDIDGDRVALAASLGMDVGLDPKVENQIDQINRLTKNIGADGAVITAASQSNDILSMAFKMCRKKGRVVLVGDVGIDIKRSDIYKKELDFFISTAYGPGRYDEEYEEHGLDYPIGYVRWTENRNMCEYLRLLSEGRVNVEKLISKIYPLDSAPNAYEDLQNASSKPLITLLSYPYPKSKKEYDNKITLFSSRRVPDRQIRIAVIGAGNFASATHLPNLKRMPDVYTLQAVCSRMGHNARNQAKKFQAVYATTDYAEVLANSDVDAVLIATRHNLHGQIALEALNANKHVLVEKPLSLGKENLEKIKEYYQQNPQGPVLLTGFNRRFSPHLQHIKRLVEKRTNPMIINYQMNAGYIPKDHWVHRSEGGGRNIGEACHIYDLFTFLTDSKVKEIGGCSINPEEGYYTRKDNFICVVSFDDGSVGSLTYTALGTNKYSKEKMKIYFDGQIIVLDDYKSVICFGRKDSGTNTKNVDKGFAEELRNFAKAIRGDAAWPNPLWQQVQAMEMAFEVEKFI